MLINGDCLEKMKDIPDKSVDLIFCDLPYGQTSCKWDCPIDLDIFWKEVMRVKKLNTPILMTTTTKFGVSLIQSAPKKCHFRYDLVWCKSAPCGFLSAKKMPMRKHEMIYVFYEKLPLYDLSSHKHKFIKTKPRKNDNLYGMKAHADGTEGKYEPPLPTSLVEPGNNVKPPEKIKGKLYGADGRKKPLVRQGGNDGYEPPLPTSLIEEEVIQKNENCNTAYGNNTHYSYPQQKNGESIYEPPLPTSLVEEDEEEHGLVDCYGYHKNEEEHKKYLEERGFKDGQVLYDPPLPHSLLQIKSTRGKHSTEKPVALMEWILKYYSKEGDTVLDPTMGSGSMGVGCKNMNRNFIGIEMDEKIFKVAEERLS